MIIPLKTRITPSGVVASMRTIMMLAICFGLFFSSAAAQGNPQTDQGRQAALEQLLKAQEEAATQSKARNYPEAIRMFNAAIAAAEPVLGPGDEEVIKTKILLGAICLEGGNATKDALTVLNQALVDSARTLGAYSRQTASINALLMNARLQLGDLNAARNLADRTLVGYIESWATEEQTRILFQHTVVTALAGQIDKAAFFAKLWIGVESFCMHGNQGYSTSLDVEGVLEEMKDRLHMPIDVDAAKNLLKQPNAPDDTPYTKAHSIMTGRESALYARFGEAGAALAAAGESKNPEQQESARRDFRAWLDMVDSTFAPAK